MNNKDVKSVYTMISKMHKILSFLKLFFVIVHVLNCIYIYFFSYNKYLFIYIIHFINCALCIKYNFLCYIYILKNIFKMYKYKMLQ